MPNQIEVVTPSNDIIALFQQQPLRSVKKAEQVQDLLGQDAVNITVESVEPLELVIGQRVTVFGKTYYLNQMPTAKIIGERRFEYDLTFEGPQYTLRRAAFFNEDISGFNTTTDFSITGNAELFLDVIINNLNRVFGSGNWIKGEFPTTPAKTISFNEMNCLAAVQTICKDFETEFDIVQAGSTHTLHIRKAGQILGFTYQYGRVGGLYELTRRTVTDQDVVNRLYAFGSSKNLKSGYRDYSQRLRLPLTDYIEDPTSIAAFGIREGVKVYDDVYPRRTGYVTTAGTSSFQDSTIDFDLNESDSFGTKYLIDGVKAKVHFNTGNLAGYEFEIEKYTHSTKTFSLIPYTDERGQKFPDELNVAFQLQVGDEYVILDISLPASYVETAELELLNRAQLHLDQVKAPKVQYELKVDRMHLEQLAGPGAIFNFYRIGDYIKVLDGRLGVDKTSRIISLRRDVLNPYSYTLTLDDTYQVTILQQIIEAQKETNRIIKVNDLRDPNRARMGWKTTQELLNSIFDTEGYFDGGKIKPESIETMMLVVGAKSQQFILQNLIIQPNYEGNPNVVAVSDGLLIHYALKEEIVTWQIQEALYTIPDNAFRYAYAKVSKTNYDEGYIIFSTEQILPDEDPNYYHFLVGALHSVMEGVRWFNLTYGATAINGRFIKTGRVMSFDGRTFFDLDSGQIGGYIQFIDSNGNYRDLTDIGAQTDVFFQVSVIEEPETYTDGKVTAWLQSTNPATWPSGEESYHEGDMWYNPGADTVSRRVAGSWVAVTDSATLKAYQRQFARLGDGAKVQMFVTEPTPVYTEFDLWMSPEGLRRSIKNKPVGLSFDINDWVEPFNYDSTVTAIDGGVVTSGTIQLAGDKFTVLAGITGEGTEQDSVRFWAGASYINRSTAPFRVFQSGEVIGRTRIEVEGVDGSSPTGYRGQAGLAGSEEEGKTGVRIYAGSDYEGRDSAPFRVTGEGQTTMKKGIVGNWSISSDGGIVNTAGDAYVVARRTTEGSTETIIGPNIFSSTLGGVHKGAGIFRANEINPGGNNYGAIFEASGAVPGVLGENGQNYAIYANNGRSMFGEALLNGRSAVSITISSGSYYPIDAALYDCVICNYPNSGTCAVQVTNSASVKAGKEIIIISNNDVNRLWIQNTIQGDVMANIQGGSVLTLIYTGTNWRTKSVHDNNW